MAAAIAGEQLERRAEQRRVGTQEQLAFPPGDPIVTLSGVTGTYTGAPCVGQLAFTTAGGITFSPFGTLVGVIDQQNFTLSAPAGCRINSFFGTTYEGGAVITPIGGNVLPL